MEKILAESIHHHFWTKLQKKLLSLSKILRYFFKDRNLSLYWYVKRILPWYLLKLKYPLDVQDQRRILDPDNRQALSQVDKWKVYLDLEQQVV